jgi:3-hydroxybutyryl-CoA dehydrogenase
VVTRKDANVPERIGVIGAGTMGVGIAYVFAAAGFKVHVADPKKESILRLESTLTEQAAQGVKRGKLSPSDAAGVLDRVTSVSCVDDLPQQLDLLVESAPEDLLIKRNLLSSAELLEPCVLASNTSSLSIQILSQSLRNPSRFLGMHFFNPVWSLALVELVVADETSVETVETCRRYVDTLGKEPLVVRDSPGFATSRLDVTSALEAMRMLEEGVASAEDIDRAIVLAYRHPVGPLRLSDIVGLDVRLHIAQQLEETLGSRFSPPNILREKVASGQLGVKSGVGFFAWD